MTSLKSREEVEIFQKLLDALQSTSIEKEKEALLCDGFRRYPFLIHYVRFAYDTKQDHFITSAHTEHARGIWVRGIPSLIRHLIHRKLSPIDACRSWWGALQELPKDLQPIANHVLDRDLPWYTTRETLDKALAKFKERPIERLYLCWPEKWTGEEIWNESGWYACDYIVGARCIITIGPGIISIRDAKGIQFKNLLGLESLLSSATYMGTAYVLDGYITSPSIESLGVENLRMVPKPLQGASFLAYDYVPLHEFQAREGTALLPWRMECLEKSLAPCNDKYITHVQYTPITSQKRFDSICARAKDKGIRTLLLKKESGYVTGRSKEVLSMRLT